MPSILHKLRKVVLTLSPKIGSGICAIQIVPTLRLRVNADRYGIRLFAHIEKTNKQSLAVRCPVLAKQTKTLKGYQCEVGFRHENHSYYFNSAILDKLEDDVILMTLPQKINETQRREDVRLFSGIKVELEEIDGTYYNQNILKLESKDVSAGGMRLHCPITHAAEPVKIYTPDTYETLGSELSIRFTLPGNTHTYRTKAEVTWIQRVEKEHEIGIRYEELPHTEQQAIVQYIYREQIREKKLKERRVKI